MRRIIARVVSVWIGVIGSGRELPVVTGCRRRRRGRGRAEIMVIRRGRVVILDRRRQRPFFKLDLYADLPLRATRGAKKLESVHRVVGIIGL